jgi:hypothetical protein
MAEHRFRKAGVEGSNPSIGFFFFAEHSPIGYKSQYGLSKPGIPFDFWTSLSSRRGASIPFLIEHAYIPIARNQ